MDTSQDVHLYAPIRREKKHVRWHPGTSFDTRGIAISHRTRAQINAEERRKSEEVPTGRLTIIALRRTRAQDLAQFVFTGSEVYKAQAIDFEQFGDFEPSPEPLLPTLENVQEAIRLAAQNSVLENSALENAQEVTAQEVTAQEVTAQEATGQNTVQEDTLQADGIPSTMDSRVQDP
jgi:hypothetical protein